MCNSPGCPVEQEHCDNCGMELECSQIGLCPDCDEEDDEC